MSTRQSGLLPSADEGAFDRICRQLNRKWIEAALEATGTATVRKRRLPAEQVVWLVLGMALYRHRPIDELVERLDLVLPGAEPIVKSAVSQARSRLGSEPMRWLFEKTSEKWGHESARRHRWRGLAVYGVDGTTGRVPDSAENRAHFGGPNSSRGGGLSGYPMFRMVTLTALRSHLLAAARFGPYALSEHLYAMELWEKVPDDSLCIVDKGFWDTGILVPLARGGKNRHWMIRAKSNTAWTTLKKLGRGEELVELEVSWYSRQKDPSLPKRFIARAVRYQRKGFRPQWLLTSLVDREAFPASEIISLYHERWEMELGYDEVKTEMLERQEAIRRPNPRRGSPGTLGRGPRIQFGAAGDGTHRRGSPTASQPNQLHHRLTPHPGRMDVARRDFAWGNSETPSSPPRRAYPVHSPSPPKSPPLPARCQNQNEQLPTKTPSTLQT